MSAAHVVDVSTVAKTRQGRSAARAPQDTGLQLMAGRVWVSTTRVRQDTGSQLMAGRVWVSTTCARQDRS